MKKIFILSTLAVILAITFSCSSDSPTEPQTGITDEQRAFISQAHESISAVADSLLLVENPVEGFKQMRSSFEDDPNVDSAWIKDDALWVKYKKGGIASWYNVRDDVKPPYLPKLIGGKMHPRRVSADNLVGNNKVCLLNQVFNDEDRVYCRNIINRLSSEFTQNGFEVTIVNGEDVDLGFLDSELSDFGTIYYICHGNFDGTNTWVLSGQEGNVSWLMKFFYWDWVKNEISVGTVIEERDGEEVPIQFVMISNNFIEDEYGTNSFPNSLIYMIACQFFTSQNFGNAFIGRGAGAVVGWDETNCQSPYVGEHLFNSMLGGLDLSEAIDLLPEESKVDFCAVDEGANLTFSPSTGGTIRLVARVVNPPEIQLSAPINGQFYYTQLISLSGTVVNAQSIDYGTVELNGLATTMQTNGLNFSQPLIIQQGTNKIALTCLTTLADGTSATINKTITVTGDFPTLDLFTELRWNTNYSDVDFHLLPPGFGLDALATDDDCYYRNMAPDWGGTLDVDDVDGYGPEHIEIASASINGTYRLFVHYYDDDGMGSSEAFVDVSTHGGEIVSFGPYQLNNSYSGYNGVGNIGDYYEVCTIQFPSGLITPVNKYYNIANKGGSAKLNMKPKSKK